MLFCDVSKSFILEKRASACMDRGPDIVKYMYLRSHLRKKGDDLVPTQVPGYVERRI